jgi:hypothetical protein
MLTPTTASTTPAQPATPTPGYVPPQSSYPAYGPQGPYPPPYAQPYVFRPPKDRSVALILEILPGLFGFLGFGWIYSGNTHTGIMWLIGVFIWDILAVIIDIATGGFGCFCTLPINVILIAISASSLNTYTKQHPELFGK